MVIPKRSGSYHHNLGFLQGGTASLSSTPWCFTLQFHTLSEVSRCGSKGIFFLPIKENTHPIPSTAACHSPRASGTFLKHVLQSHGGSVMLKLPHSPATRGLSSLTLCARKSHGHHKLPGKFMISFYVITFVSLPFQVSYFFLKYSWTNA